MWSGAITVAVLAIVLIVFASISPLASRKPSTTAGQPATSQPVDESTALYMQAVAAQKSGDLTRTVELARSALQANPSNADAQRLLDAATKESVAGSSAKPPTGSTIETGTTKPSAATDPLFLKIHKPLAVLLPTAIDGFDMGVPIESKGDVTKSGRPKNSKTPVYSIIVAAHDRKTYSSAKSFITKTSKVAFPKDSAAVTVDGVDGYFGTDGMKFATLSFARGRYAFEVLVTASTGYDPRETKSAALAAAKAFPDSPSQ